MNLCILNVATLIIFANADNKIKDFLYDPNVQQHPSFMKSILCDGGQNKCNLCGDVYAHNFTFVHVDDLRVRYNTLPSEDNHTNSHKIGAMFFNSGNNTNCSVVMIAAYRAEDFFTTNVALSVIKTLFKRQRAHCNFAIVWNANPRDFSRMWFTRKSQAKTNPRNHIDKLFFSSKERANLPHEVKTLMRLDKERMPSLILCLQGHGQTVVVPKIGLNAMHAKHGKNLLREATHLASTIKRITNETFRLNYNDEVGTHTDFLLSDANPSHMNVYAFRLKLFESYFPNLKNVNTLTGLYSNAILEYIKDFSHRCSVVSLNDNRRGQSLYYKVHNKVLVRVVNKIFESDAPSDNACPMSCQLYSANTLIVIIKLKNKSVKLLNSDQDSRLNHISDVNCKWKRKSANEYFRYLQNRLRHVFGNGYKVKRVRDFYACGQLRNLHLQQACLHELWINANHIIANSGGFIVAVYSGTVTHDGWLRCHNTYQFHKANHAIVVYGQARTSTFLNRTFLIIHNGRRLHMSIEPNTSCMGKGTLLWAEPSYQGGGM